MPVDGFSGVPLLPVMGILCTVINLLFRAGWKIAAVWGNRKPFMKQAIRERKRTIMKMRRVSVCLLLAALSITLLLCGCGQHDSQTTEMVYHVYFGLNDADTGKQEVTTDDASSYIRSVIESYGYGYTEHRTYGAYTENGESKGNDTLVYMLTFVEEENVEKIANEVVDHLNLASVLCQKEEMPYTFYAGEEKQS